MNYLLTREEYEHMRPLEDVQRLERVRTILREKVLAATGFPCIHERPRRNEYCDDCPCSPHADANRALDEPAARQLCELPRNWSK